MLLVILKIHLVAFEAIEPGLSPSLYFLCSMAHGDAVNRTIILVGGVPYLLILCACNQQGCILLNLHDE